MQEQDEEQEVGSGRTASLLDDMFDAFEAFCLENFEHIHSLRKKLLQARYSIPVCSALLCSVRSC